MYKTATLMMMVCESPLHAGTGSDLDFIDKPIQRERHTGHPKIEGGSLKGALRERFSKPDRNEVALEVAFGPDNPEPGKERQGALGFSDARLLLFPVKSMKGVFAWITCPAVLKRFQMDMRRIPGREGFSITGLDQVPPDKVLVFSNALVIRNAQSKEHVVLEEFAYEVGEMEQPIAVDAGKRSLNDWLADQLFPTSPANDSQAYWNSLLRHNLILVPDTDFTDFTELTTEVITRNKINPETGTVQNGHLFTEEYLPADSVLYALVMAHPEFKAKGEGQGKKADEILGYFRQQLTVSHSNCFQAGGNATIGKGLIRSVLIDSSTTKS